MSIIEERTKWPALARDLAILSAPDAPITVEEVCKHYHLTKTDVDGLSKTPAFQSLLRKEIDLAAKMGDKAGARYRAIALSQVLSEKLFDDAVNGGMDSKDALKLLEVLMKAAGLNEAEKPTVQMAVQNNVRLSLPQIPKLAHAIPTESLPR